MRSDRLISTLLLLREHGRLTERELAERLGVPELTVRRDLKELAASGPLVERLPEPGVWQLDDSWRKRVELLDEAELNALLMSTPTAIGDNGFASARESAISKMTAGLPQTLRERVSSIRQRVCVDTTDWRGISDVPSALPVVQEAVLRDRKLAIQYWRGGHERVQRVVDPLGLISKTGAWYLVAQTPDGFRTYRVSRIEEATLLDLPSERPAGFDLAAHWRSSTRQFREGLQLYQATLRLEPRAAVWMKMSRNMPNAEVVEDTGSGSWITMRVQFDHEEQACFVVLGLGSRVEVIEPARLRERVAADAAAGMSTIIEEVDGTSFAPAGFDRLFRELEAQRLEAARKLESERRSAQELEIAKQVQARLFPQTVPALRTLDYAGLCIQAREVGGDYYDFLDLGRSRLGLVIGDISGKGIAAALLMANLQANLRSQCAVALDHPQRLMQSVNRLFYENTAENAYATLFFAVYDDSSGHLAYVNCGHHSALLLRGDGAIEKLGSTCTVLGLFEEWDCATGERQLRPGDALALYTDGVTESFNAAGEEFGEQRLIGALQRNRNLTSRNLLAAIVDEVKEFSRLEQHDDFTLIVAKCREKAGGCALTDSPRG